MDDLHCQVYELFIKVEIQVNIIDPIYHFLLFNPDAGKSLLALGSWLTLLISHKALPTLNPTPRHKGYQVIKFSTPTLRLR